MAGSIVGLVAGPGDTATLIAEVQRLEKLGVPAVWLTCGGAGPDALTLIAAAAMRTERVKLGTAVVPTFPRHPVAVVQQVQAIAALAPGRFRLGLGPSHQPVIEGTFGLSFQAPLGHLREYVHIVRELLHSGAVDFEGRYYRARARIGAPLDVPVMLSALRRRSFELCGALADGAISWMCPATYLRDAALPAMRQGASQAMRPAPPLIAHAPVCVHDNAEDVRAAVREQFTTPQRLFYARMFADAGFPEAAEGRWSDAMIGATVISGGEAQVASRIQELFTFGAAEAMLLPFGAGEDRARSLERTVRLAAEVARQSA